MADRRENKLNKTCKKIYEILIKFVMSLVCFGMIGCIFLLGKIQYDPEEENKSIHEKKKAE